MKRVAFAALLLVACIAPTQRREENLINDARTFNDDIRWARWDAMASALPADEAQRLRARAEEIGEDLVIGDYEVTSVTFARGSDAAQVVVKFGWYMKNEAILRNTTVGQSWEYGSGRWVMAKQRRLKGDRFPLVPEAMKPATTPDAGAP